MEMLLLSGIPASGKSHFGRWLEAERSYLHLDIEKDGRLAAFGLLAAWNGCFSGLGVEPFVQALRRLRRSMVINWGFPPRFLGVVQELKGAGLSP